MHRPYERRGEPIFQTIIENIRSFFQKEDELLQKPKQLPDAASEVLEPATAAAGQPSASHNVHNIVDKHLPEASQAAAANTRKAPKLPFSAAQLRKALPGGGAKSTSPSSSTPFPSTPLSSPSSSSSSSFSSSSPSSPTSSPSPSSATAKQESPADVAPHEMVEDIRAFEEAVGSLDGHEQFEIEDTEPELSSPQLNTVPVGVSSSSASSTRQPLRDGFFASFEQLLDEQDPATVDLSYFEGDLLHKMHVFHERRREGKEPFLRPEDATQRVRRRLNELQILENEWHERYKQVKGMELAMLHIEEDIDQKTRELRTMLQESRHFSLLSKEVPEGQAFVLASGEKVRSLSSLRRALAAMGREEFTSYVDAFLGKNDFASWVQGVYKDPALTAELRSAGSREEMISILSKMGTKLV